MYRIKCDDFPILDVRDDELMVENPKVKVEVNTVGEGSFTIYKNHPHYAKLKKLKSVFEVSDDVGVIFRGRMTDDTRDFYNGKAVDLEGAMAFFNDSVVPPFNYPDDFLEDADYIEASTNGNVVEFFLNWLIENHNSQVQDFQKFKLGNVTVEDINNYITRSDSGISNTWETLKSKLFESALGGFLCIRYEADGNYIDYLSDFELFNTQDIDFGENLLDLKHESDASTTYSVVVPIGAEIEIPSETEGVESTKKRVTLESIPDGVISDEIYKITLPNGLHALYSNLALEQFGWIVAPVGETTFEDVTEVQNLLTKGKSWLLHQGILLADTVEITAADLHFTDDEIQSFRIYRKIKVKSEPHGIDEIYDLTKLEIPLLAPQDTKITVGETKLSLIDQNAKIESENQTKIEKTENNLKEYVATIKKGLELKIETIDGIFFYIKYSDFEDGHVMTNEPTSTSKYMGVCSTNQPEAPTDYREYTWSLVRGQDGQDGADGQDGKDGTDGTPGQPGKDGKSNYFHVKYSNDGQTFTANGGEELGDWMGTCVTETENDPTDFNAYIWKKIKGEPGLQGIQGIQGEKGEQGIAGEDGKDGIDGKTTYFHIKYSAVANPTSASQMTETPSKYIGTYVDYTQADSTDPSKYTWTQFIGNDGKNGADGQDGIAGKNGVDGKTYYLHIKYSDDGGKTLTANSGETSGKYIGVYTDTTQADSTDVSKYQWSLIKGKDGIDGIDGVDGKDGISTYFFVKFSANADGSSMTETPNDNTKYMGVCNTTSSTAPTTPSSYKWTKVRGNDGSDGQDGQNGSDGKGIKSITNHYLATTSSSGVTTDTSGWTTTVQAITSSKRYLWNYETVTYTDDSTSKTTPAIIGVWGNTGSDGKDGTNGTNGKDGADGSDGADGVGISSIKEHYAVSSSNSTAPTTWYDTPQTMTSTNKYLWNYETVTYTDGKTEDTAKRVIGVYGDKGIAGNKGADGKTSYLHIKYSDNGTTFTANNGETLGAWIGTYVDFTETDSTTFSDYTWKKFTGDVNVGGRNLLVKSDTAQDVPGGTSWRKAQYDLSEYGSMEIGETYTLTTDFTPGAGLTQFQINNSSGLIFTSPYAIVSNGTDRQTVSITFKTTKAESSHIRLYALPNDGTQTGTTTVHRIKLEKGNIATDHTLAPEDMATADDITDVKDDIASVRSEVIEQTTSVLNTSEAILMEALKSYTSTGDFDSYKETVEGQLELIANQMTVKFTETIQQIEDVDGDLQEKFNQITKYFAFDINGLTIGQVDNPFKVIIDNDLYRMTVNGVDALLLDPEGLSTIPELKVTKRFELFGFLIDEDEAGNVNCEYIGGGN